MYKRIVGATCAAALLSIGAAAAGQAAPQTPTQSPVRGSTPGASQQDARPTPPPAAGEMTVTGCVTREVAGQFALSNAISSDPPTAASRRDPSAVTAGSAGSPGRDGATEGAAGTTGRAGTRPGAEADAGAEAGAGGASGVTGAQGSPASRQGASGDAATGTTYSLTGERENELEKYVGERVEIVGTLGATGAAAAASPGSSSGTAKEDPGDASRAPVTRPEGTSSTAGDANRGRASSQPAHMPRLTVLSVRPVGGLCS